MNITPELRALLVTLGMSEKATDDEARAFLATDEVQAKIVARGTPAQNPPAVQPVAPKVTVNDAARCADIADLAREFDCVDLQAQAMRDGTSAADFQGVVLARLRERNRQNTVAPQASAATPELGMSRKELKRYSLHDAIRSMIPGEQGDFALVREASAATAKLMGRDARGIMLPYDYMTDRTAVQVGNTGGNLVATNQNAANFVELLRNARVLPTLGLRMMEGLVGDEKIPVQTGGATAGWVGKSTAQAESSQTYD